MLYSRVATLNVGPGGQKSPQVGNGAGTAVGIFEVPKYWPPPMTNPSQLVAFRPSEASQPCRPAQWPALKGAASAYEPPPKNSMRGYWTGGAGLAAVGAGISASSGAGGVAGAWAGAGA